MAAGSARAPSSNASDRARRRSVAAALAAIAATVVGTFALVTACTGSQGAASFGAPGDDVEANAVIAKVVDGDTIDVRTGPGDATTRVRMIGFDTPESVDPRRPVECFGKEASKHLATLAPAGTSVRLERDAEATDRYGRTLAYVYRASDGVFLNERMVADGYAHTLSIPPNVTHAELFRAAERAARIGALGLWSACPIEP